MKETTDGHTSIRQVRKTDTKIQGHSIIMLGGGGRNHPPPPQPCQGAQSHHVHKKIQDASIIYIFSLSTFVFFSFLFQLSLLFCIMASSPFARRLRRISSQLRFNLSRRKSTSSNASRKSSTKSVRFQPIDSIYYTHSAAEYDRTPVQEEQSSSRPALGQCFFADPDDLDDQMLIRNTNHNRQRSLQAIAIHIALRAMR